MEFQGFQNQLPTLLVVVLLLLFGLLSFLSYRKQISIPVIPRYGLVALRTLSLVVVLLLFLNPFFYVSKEIDKKPRLLFLLDNSESVGIVKGDYQGLESYRNLLDELTIENFNAADIDFFSIGNKTSPISTIDSLNASETETNFISTINQIQELEDDYDASVIVSDGIITFGRNPTILAAESSIPIYTIALGDSSLVSDVVINNSISNPTGYSDTQHFVEVEVSQTGYANEEVSLQILDSNKDVLASRTVNFSADEEVQTVELQLPLTESGLQQFEVVLDELINEWTYENNSRIFSVDVLDSKTNILHVAFEIHPDVKTIRSILQEDENIELTTLTWLNGNRFVEEIDIDSDELDLIIYHGHPNSLIQNPILQELDEIPIVYFHLPNSRRSVPQSFSRSLIRNTGNQVFPLKFIPNLNSNDHPILELPEINLSIVADLSSSLRTVLYEPDALSLFNGSFQEMETPNPLIAILERGNSRQTEIAAWGFFRLYQSPNEDERDYITQLISNIVIWTSNDPDNRRLKVSPIKSLFNVSEDVIVNANLNNESGAAESDATIDLTISSEGNETQVYNMQNLGNGAYKIEFNTLSPGRYQYSATARKGNRVIDTQNGEFIIENSNSEFINTIRNDAFLTSISNETGGRSYLYHSIDTFWNDLRNDNLLDTKKELIESYQFPIRSIIWFIIILIMLGSEWLLRKFYALP